MPRRKNIMEETWESLFIGQAKSEGHSDEYIRACLDYANVLHKRKLPVIFDNLHLALYLNVSPSQLNCIINNSVRMYRSFELKKGNSKETRKISAPFPKLKVIQQWINLNILCKDIDILPCCHAFMPQEMFEKRNILTNASQHANCCWLLNMDLKIFFPNINYARVYYYFFSLGYTELVATSLAQLCCKDYKLPQGAPSSPMIANHIARGLDEGILAYCKENRFAYTRYADDITVSGNDAIDAKKLIRDMEAIIYSNGFFVNRKKTKFRLKGCRQMVTGLTIDHGVHVPKAYRKEVLKELYCCLKFGASNHITYRNMLRRNQLMATGISADKIQDLGFYKQWLLGRIMYIRSIEPMTGNKMLEQYNKISWVL